jgi:primosomal protein N' (replication factor Y)
LDDASFLTEEETSATTLSPESLPRGFTLTPHQWEAFSALREAAHSGKAETHLLFGITGSGKTAVYLELARDTLNRGRSVLLLAPEVALALKLRNDAEQALPGATRIFYHGYQSPAAREGTFRSLLDKSEPVLVVGTRSALFLPLENVGLIILDEEHDASFKQDEGFAYQAKEVAWFRIKHDNALLLLGSATPDLKTFHAVAQGRIPLHTLAERAGNSALPEIRLVRLPRDKTAPDPFAEETRQALSDTVRRGEQAVILLNRRGYAPLMYCLACGATAKCPSCDIGLAYHKGRERLLCHYCGYSTPFPSPCATCNGLHFLPMGEGTEKLEEQLAALLSPGTGVLRLDKDSTRRPGRMEEILGSFARKEAAVLVGTQMLSKGHHFPDVTLAVAVDADIGLNLPDYRAAERSFQLLLQSAGRAGRGDRPGTVIIQTRDPQHYCWQFVQHADYEGFFARELALRESRRYPPFVRLALIRISYPRDADGAEEDVAALGALLRGKARELGVTALGPAPAPLPVLKGRRRFHCLLKGMDWTSLRAVYATAFASSVKGHLRIALDIDPVNML